MATVRAMLPKVNVNFPASIGVKRNSLQGAVELGNMGVVGLLLELAADVNAPASARGRGTALQLAAHKDFTTIFRLLGQHGAVIYAPASKVNGRAPLEGAADMGRLDMVAEGLNPVRRLTHRKGEKGHGAVESC
jgi:ankyrin repeat protein